MKHATHRFVLCLRDGGNDDLVPRKVYECLSDAKAKRDGLLRVVDESGDDYLYPTDLFVAVELPARATVALTAAE